MPDTAAVNLASQSLFRNEYELELESWLRRRFRAVCLFYMIMGVVVIVFRMGNMVFGKDKTPLEAVLITLAGGLTSLAIVAFHYLQPQWRIASREQILRGASMMILLIGAISLLKGALVQWVAPNVDTDFLLPLFFWHFIACLFLPWTPRESLRPTLPLLALWMLGVLFLQHNIDAGQKIAKIIFGLALLIPGLGICAIRLKYHSENFRSRMVGKQFMTMREELTKARTIHESMFPAQHDDGFVRFEYTYRPARELGGDYVHVHVSPQGLLHLTLIDVTGHGLAAALTVNRLYGELERIRAESPSAEPGEVLTLLNRYVNLTMVKHNIYVTAMCITLDPYLGRLFWANAGHPPAFLRGANGVVADLAATTVLLGALDASEFSADQQSKEMSPGDAIVMYTDGAFEGRDRAGKQLGLHALSQLMHSQPPPRNWSQFITSAVEKHNAGRSDDDILVAAITFKAPRPQVAPLRRAVAAS